MAGLVILAVLLALGAAAGAGLTPDTRDQRYGMGAVLTWLPKCRGAQVRDDTCSG